MKFFDWKTRLIARLAVLCFFAVVGSRVAQAQGTPKSGALLTISGSAGGAVNIAIYDSQIHSGTVQSVPVGGGSFCIASDQIPTDAYVLQGGSADGCDAGDAFEVTDNNTSEGAHQAFGKTDVTVTGAPALPGTGFHIETHYICSGACSGFISPPAFSPYCNTSGTICTTASGPDSGFLTVTNNTGFAFTGTITLQGSSPIAGGSFCPASIVEGGPGVAFDTWTTGLTASEDGSSVRLALGSEGSTESPKGADTSNCGGFNAPQTLPLTAGQTTIFAFGNDAYKFTPQNSNVGDQLTFLPIPVPAGPLGPAVGGWVTGDFGTQAPENPVSPSSLRFSATNYPGQACIPISDFSAIKNPVCPEIQLGCTSTSEVSDCTTFLYSFEYDFAIDENSLPGGVGGVNYVADQADQCPTAGFNMDNFLSYTATAPDPIRGPGNPIGCFAAIFNPTTAAVPVGQTVTQHTFKGFFFPVIDSTPNHVFFNQIDPGSIVSLIWQTKDSSGKPVPNLHLCNNLTGNGCVKPWVTLESLEVGCPNAPLPGPAPSPTLDASFFNSGLIHLGDGFYAFLWQTPRSSPVGSCVTPVLVFSTGFLSFDVANFQFER
jgi:hypothetical protein